MKLPNNISPDTMTHGQLLVYCAELEEANRKLQARGTQLTDEVRALRATLQDSVFRRIGRYLDPGRLSAVVGILTHAYRADNKHGTPLVHIDRPDGVGSPDQVAYEVLAKDRCERAGKSVSWALICDEENAEVQGAKNLGSLESELQDSAATCLRWLEAIRLRRERDVK